MTRVNLSFDFYMFYRFSFLLEKLDGICWFILAKCPSINMLLKA